MRLYSNINEGSNIKYYGDVMFFITLLMSLFGIIMVYSSTACKADGTYTFLKKQIISLTIGIFLCGFMANVRYTLLKKITNFLFFLNIILLISVFFFPSVKGAHRWIFLPILGNFQPSELARLALILFIAKYLDSHRSKIIDGKKQFWVLFSVVLVFCVLIGIQPDIGTPAIILSTFLILLFVTSVKLKYFLKILFIFLSLLFVALIIEPYRIKRILALSDKDKYQKSTGYQLEQSVLSISRGGFYGCGLTRGIFKEQYLPEIHTDFIFSIIGEELGFIGSSAVVFSYVLLGILGFLIFYKLQHSNNGFYGSIITLGIVINILIQAYLSMSVTTKLFLPKGIGLPFISYGGSSLIVNFLSVGIVISIARNSK
ncbi:MAG: putative lipid II flippase FtsW [Endomicrobia bacterium]|nr:putative lipid II flippase FtsW [Endomicrobiia bacterium]